MENIIVKEVWIDEVVRIWPEIIEFDESYKSDFFTHRYEWKKKLIIVAYIDDKPAWYIVGYQREDDWSFYCWMAWVSINFRRKGILTHLMDYQYSWWKEQWYKKITIKTRNARREMLSYLVKNWFNFTWVDVYPIVIENRILLEKVII